MTHNAKRGIAGLMIAAVIIAVTVLLAIARLAPGTFAVSQWLALVGVLIGAGALASWMLRKFKD